MAHHAHPHMIPQDISPLIMPPSEFNIMMPQGAYAQLARSMANRRPYSSATTPGSSKRSSIRISKSGTHGHSPHHVQRRRTTATHTHHEHYPGVTTCVRSKDGRLYNGTNHAVANPRPFSWHPDSALSPLDHDPNAADQFYMSTTISGIQNLAMDNSPPPSDMQDLIQDNLTSGYGYRLPVYLPHQYQPATEPNSHYVGPEFLPYEVPRNCQTGESPQSNFPAQSYDRFNLQSEPSRSPSWQLAPQNQLAGDTHLYTNKTVSVPSYGGSEELVGIGLYDDKEQGHMVATNESYGDHKSPSQRGKELKLEESWQPPESQDNDDDSSEEAEEVNTIEPPAKEVQSTVYAPYSDLSNQSFFFGDEEAAYMGDQGYTDYMALQSGFGMIDDWKGQPAGLHNLMYI